MRKSKRTRLTLIMLCTLVCSIILPSLVTPVSAGPLSNFYESPIPYWDDHSGDAVSVTWSGTNQTIILAGGDASSNLSIGVPVLREESQQVVVMMSVANLSSTVRFQLSDDGTASGQYVDVNGTHVTFRGGSYGNVTDEVVLDFFCWDVHNRFWIQAYNDTGLIARWESWYGLAGNNWFNMTSTNFNGTLELFYLEGDTDYRTLHNVPTWIRTGSAGSGVEQTASMCMVTSTDSDINHDATYTIDMPYFAYLRTEQYFDASASGAGDADAGTLYDPQGFRLEFRKYNSSGDEDIYIQFVVQLYGDTVSGSIKVWSNITIEVDGEAWGLDVNMNSNTIADNDGSTMHVGIWRTLNDQVGVMWSSDTYIYELDGVDHSTDVAEHTTWVSDESWSDWSNCTLTLKYDVWHDIVGSYDLFEYFSYEQWEADIYHDSGVAQPHFSTVWWTSSGNQWSDFTAPFYSEEDAYTEPWNPWQWLVDSLSFWFETIGGVIAGALIAIPMLGGAMVATIINLFVPGGGPAFFGVLTDIGVAIGGIFGIIPFLFDVFGMIIGHVTFWINWLFTYIITAENMVWIGLTLVAIPIIIARVRGPDAAVGFVMTWYVGTVIALFKAVYTIIMGVLNLIAGFLPGT
jgi:hypothetical protein